MLGAVYTLDPFGHFPEVASRIDGLGGTNPSDNPSYAFFTPYVPATGGHGRFSARFSGVIARSGTLSLSVYALPRGSVAHARRVKQQHFNLIDAGEDIDIELDVKTFPGAAYALVGEISPDSVVSARELDVTWRADGKPAGPEFLAGYESDAVPISLLAAGPALLADPVSQMCTATQFDEPEFAFWASQIESPPSRHRKQWEFIFILQSLARYGALRPGARGLGFGVGREPLPSLFASMGIDVLATDLPAGHSDVALWNTTMQHAVEASELHWPGICSKESFDRHVRYRPVDMNAISNDIVDYDFTWSSCAYEHLGSIDRGLTFVEQSLKCLRPGGIAIHTTEINLTSDDVTVDHAATVLFRRRDFVQLALRLIAQGHHVAPLCFNPGETPVDSHLDLPPYTSDPHLKIAFGCFAITSFGIIARRGG